MTAYLPIGSVLCRRGRGQRREQAAFLQRVKRQASKKRPLKVVAQVESVQAVSSTSVLAPTANCFQITVMRQGIAPQEEAATLERYRQMQFCAMQLVDKAAHSAGVDVYWARRVALHEPYHRSLRQRCATTATKGDDGDNGGDDACDPMYAALRLLMDSIGTCPDETTALDFASNNLLANCDPVVLEEVTIDGHRSFVQDLVSRCWTEQQRRSSKPVTVSLPVNIGHLDAIVNTFKTEASSADSRTASCHVGAIEAALRSLEGLEPPPECSKLSIVVQGAGKFCFSTRCVKTSEAAAHAYLRAAKEEVLSVWSNFALHNEAHSKSVNDSATKATESAVGDLQPSLTIGLIGDVANGKSTLVQAMSGKRTQAHSSEQQKHGMTIRLGFANAAILRCCDHDSCGTYGFASEKDAVDTLKLPVCANCGGKTSLSKRVSFTDCPGHQELMATMLSGASAFDAVILAAASTLPCPTPQARQHLEALERTRSRIAGRIAVAQTKAELVVNKANNSDHRHSAETLLELHANTAKESLKGTVADDAPIFPVCAPSRLGLGPLARWIATLPENTELESRASSARIFNVLRSFDVNHPKSFTSLRGGVLGGTVGSGVFRPGDEIEVRPGLFLGHKERTESESGESNCQPFDIRPIECQCVGIMTGNSAISQASSGGLVAMQTSLSPSLCADDHLVGSVAGSKGSMPPVWGPVLLLDGFSLISGDPVVFHGIRSSKRLVEGSRVRCHVGSSTVVARVHRVSMKRGKLELRLERPLCAFKGSKVVLEAEVSGRSGFYLVANASLFGGNCCLEGSEENKVEGVSLVSSLETAGKGSGDDDIMHRKNFLYDLASRDAAPGGERMRISVCKPQVKQDGGAHVVVENFAAIAACLHRDQAHLVFYLQREAALSCVPCGEAGGALRVRTRNRGFAELLQKIVIKYASTFVCCHQCKSGNTEIFKTTNNVELVCRQCNARRFVPKI